MTSSSTESDRALLVVDMTVERISPHQPLAVPGAEGLIRYVQGEVRYFRERGRPVIFACTVDGTGVVPTVIQELTPRTGERVIYKRAFSAFHDTDLAEILQSVGARRLTLTGVETNTSILLTAADALSRGLHVVVPEPCTCARDPDDQRFALRQIRDVWPARLGRAPVVIDNDA